LAKIWMAARDRQRVADAADRIDSYLKWLPSQVGKARDGLIRILVVRPLAVHYEVHEADRKVVVVMVGRLRSQ
jgi:hypothetical protein